MKNGFFIDKSPEIKNIASPLKISIKGGVEPEFLPYQVEGRKGVSIFNLYDEKQSGGPTAALVRYIPGASTPRHYHPSWELILILDGELIDDQGHHPEDLLLVYPPGSSHELSSEKGCTLLVIWEKPALPVSPTTDNLS